MSAQSLRFAKLEGAGNGYLAIDGRGVWAEWAQLARAMAHERIGAGSDGLVVAQASEHAALRMRVFNSDGSEAEMSGNGIRLFAKFVLDRQLAALDDGALEIETAAGLRRVWPRLEGGRVASARVAMGEPVFEPSQIPVDVDALGRDASLQAPLVDVPLRVGDRELPVTCLSLGNPHAVAILDEPVEDFPLAELGPKVQAHAFFPQRVNFEIVNVLGPGELRARIFERGEGETLASGTGSTACAVAAKLHALTDDAVELDLRGGRLRVEWPGQGEAWLEGPAREVYVGDWPLAEFSGEQAGGTA